MAIYRTAQGRKLDMSQLAAKNEKTRAVGNMNVNARGDTIDSNGKVIVPVTKKVGNRYNNAVKTESNRASPVIRKKPEADVIEEVVEEVVEAAADTVAPPAKVIKEPIPVTAPVESMFEEMSDEDLEYLEPTDEDFEIEEIKKAEIEAQSKKK